MEVRQGWEVERRQVQEADLEPSQVFGFSIAEPAAFGYMVGLLAIPPLVTADWPLVWTPSPTLLHEKSHESRDRILTCACTTSCSSQPPSIQSLHNRTKIHTTSPIEVRGLRAREGGW